MRMAERFAVDEKVALGSVHFSAEDIIRFARKFDPQPFHTDAEAAKHFVFGALCASGWHTCSAWMKCFVDYWRDESECLRLAGQEPPKLGPSPGFHDLSWLKPVFAGDTIDYSIALLDSRPLASRPGRGIITALSEGVNQNGEPVMRFKSSILEFY